MTFGTNLNDVIKEVEIHIYWLKNGRVDLWIGNTQYPNRTWEDAIQIISRITS